MPYSDEWFADKFNTISERLGIIEEQNQNSIKVFERHCEQEGKRIDNLETFMESMRRKKRNGKLKAGVIYGIIIAITSAVVEVIHFLRGE